MDVVIEEIIGRSVQGVTRPFICRGDDGIVYFVKGRGAGKRSLILEWIVGQLAFKFGLPVAPFQIVEIPPELLSVTTIPDVKSELGSGNAFGSQKQLVNELTVSHFEHISDTLQCDVLAFDWWVRNADRTLSETGLGNPNLFWNITSNSLLVIDHNQAFEAEFSKSEFLQSHAFYKQRLNLFNNPALQLEYSNRFSEILAVWDEICHTVPEEWWFFDDEKTIPTDIQRNEMYQQLTYYQNINFWEQI